MKKITALLFLIIVLVGFYFYFEDNLPPRTPHKIARLISELEIDNSTEIIRFVDNLKGGEASVNSGEIIIAFSLTAEQFNNLKTQFKDKDAKNTPAFDLSYNPDFLNEVKKGIYYLEYNSNDPLDFSLVVLDSHQKNLYVFQSDS